ncbi:hypothetical protein P9112_007034 [Eukaryota sp. TZLM1-RC]
MNSLKEVSSFNFKGSYNDDVVVRFGFLRKVFLLFIFQLAVTAALGSYLISSGMIINLSSGFMLWCKIIFFSSLIGTYVFKRTFPLNLVLLSSVTITTSILLSEVVSYVDPQTVIFALVLSTLFFTALTALSFLSSSSDFLGEAIIAGILISVFTIPLYKIYFPEVDGLEIGLSLLSVLVFGSRVVFTIKRVVRSSDIDDYVYAVVLIYSDFISMFLKVLRFIASTKGNSKCRSERSKSKRR